MIVRKLGHLPFDRAYMYPNQMPESVSVPPGVGGGAGGGLLQQILPMNQRHHLPHHPQSVSPAHHPGPHRSASQIHAAQPHPQYQHIPTFPSQHPMANPEFAHIPRYDHQEPINYVHPNQHLPGHPYDQVSSLSALYYF